MNPLAEELNRVIKGRCPLLYNSLSRLGRELYFPRGILTQTAEAREKAYRYDATIGIAKARGEAMNLPVIMDQLKGMKPDEALDYAPSTGNKKLREMWLADMIEKNPTLKGKAVSMPIVTAGITHGLTIAAELFVDSGDLVIIPDKFWGNYQMIFGIRRQAEIRKFSFYSDSGGFNIDSLRETLRVALEERGKAIVILNFPNNPTGYSPLKSEAQEIVDALLDLATGDRKIITLFDDAYFGLFYDEEVCKESLFALLAGQSENLISVKLDGATKEEYVWGLRVGFITFNVIANGEENEVYEALEKKVGGAIRGNISNCSQLSQTVLLKAMEDPLFSEQRLKNYEIMKARASKVREVLVDPAYEGVWEAYPFNSGYFMCLKLKGIDAEAFRVKLLKDFGVGVIADGGDIRIAFSCLEVEEIKEVFDIMFECAIKMKEEKGRL